jgi:hypothetical protein
MHYYSADVRERPLGRKKMPRKGRKEGRKREKEEGRSTKSMS